MNSGEQEGRKPAGSAPVAARIRFRMSPFALAILALAAAEIIFCLLSLFLPWGKDSLGREIRMDLEGLLPFFLLVPPIVQAAFLMVESGLLQAFYLVINFAVAFFGILIHWLTYIKYTTEFAVGFYLVFCAGFLAVLVGFICIAERWAFPRMLASGRARFVGIGGQRPGAGAVE